ncbi:hypothetical protein D9M71_684480 [compost metagenome]
MAATFTTLRCKHVRSALERQSGKLDRTDLHHDDNARILGSRDHVGILLILRVKQGQHLRLFLEDDLELRFENVRTSERRDKVHSKRLVSEFPGFLDPLAQGLWW